MDSSDTVSCYGHYARALTPDELERLHKDTQLVTEFQQMKLEKEAQKNWDLFYKRNSTKFFKDRHWTVREFEELCGKQAVNSKVVIHPQKQVEAHHKGFYMFLREETPRKILLEVGCGVGNFIFPLIEQSSNYFIYACDFSSRAVGFVQENPLYDTNSCCAFQCDITKDSLSKWLKDDSVDVVSIIFVLSALHPASMATALKNIHQVLKPGGLVLFRDYGLYDQAMLRFAPGHKLQDNFYVRQDGTRAYYFSEEAVSKLFEEAGFLVETNCYVQRETVNYKEGISVPRIFIQGKFRKAKS